MKKLIFPLAALVMFAACKKDDPKVDPPVTTGKPVDSTNYNRPNVARTENKTAEVEAPLSLRDTIDHNVVLKADKTYTLENFVYVVNGATIRIEAGAKIVGNKTNKGSLIITRNGKIDAQGTADKPIVFTSAQPTPARGDWGGLIVLGNARTNGVFNGNNGLQEMEGGVNTSLGYALHGGNNDADNSGTLKYVRIEYAGIAFQPNSEINGLTMGSVGNGTTIDYVEVYASGDDSYEWFGGSVNCKHLISVAATDDDFDSDNGFSGKVQYGISIRDNQQADFAAGGTSNGFESDNNADGTTATPQTAAVFANFTMVGPKATSGTPATQFGRGAHIRRNSSISLLNVAMIGWNTGVRVDGQRTNDMFMSNAAELRNLFVANTATGKEIDTAGGITTNNINPAAYFATSGWGNKSYGTVAEIMLTNIVLGAGFNPAPMAASPLLATTTLNSNKTAGIETAAYVGAIGGGSTWFTGWTKF
jgi:hypothetical protein